MDTTTPRVNVIHILAKVRIVPDLMFPEPPLPDVISRLAILLADRGWGEQTAWR